MNGLELTGDRVSYRTNLAFPEEVTGEVRVRVSCAGICETDLQLMQGYMGFQGILGHEFVGVAENGKYAGRRVVGEINCPCGECSFCRRGLGTHCPSRTVLGIVNRNGAFAEFLTLPESNLHPVPDDLPDELAVFTEPVAAAFQIPAQIPDLAGKRTVLLGDGRLGNLCAQVLKLIGADVTVVGKHSRKLELISKLGIRTVLLEDLKLKKEYEVVVDCTGRASGFETALSLVQPRGKLVLKTTVAGREPINLAGIVIDEITVIGSRCGPFGPAIKALANGTVSVRELIDEVRPLATGVEALQEVRAGGKLKVQLRP
ncbi:MAG: alcohol dehydrogenase catalytic domain-containing protein [Planctomycetaceae bacterium]|nr:alcohol dehydrogenase catalytic domain-containing protein [Planctomycetaceae bacterium]